MPHYSSKSTPVIFSDLASAAAWQRINTDEDIAVAVSRDDYGYFIVRVLADDDIGAEHDIAAAFELSRRFETPSGLSETPTPSTCWDKVAAIANAYRESFDNRN